MTSANYQNALKFVWRPGFDDPADGFHVTPGDAGGGTFGGVIEATWMNAVLERRASGLLRNATLDDLAAILRDEFWGPECDALPVGIDFLLFNGRMMSGAYPRIFQSCLGFIAADVDGEIGPVTMGAAFSAAPATFANALTGGHYVYLSGLHAWPEFKHGWTTRLQAARMTALGMIRGAASAV